MIKRVLLMLFMTLGIGNVLASEQQLDTSWNKLIQGLQRAQQSLTDPASFPPESTDRNLAEGYRYLLGHLGRMIEMEMRLDPRFPEFYRSMDMLRKWTAENPDAMYLKAPIDSTGFYRVSGTVANHREWRTSERVPSGPKAPRMVTFQTVTDVPGATGALDRAPGVLGGRAPGSGPGPTTSWAAGSGRRRNQACCVLSRWAMARRPMMRW